MLFSGAVTDLGVQLVIQAPFFGHLLTGILKEEAGIDRAALTVGDGYQPLLLLGASLLEKGGLTTARRLGALKHELLHLLFRHPMQLQRAGDRTLFHLAADMVVNQYLAAPERPPDAITLDALALFSPEPLRPVWYYYDLLVQGVRRGEAALQPLLAAAAGHPELYRHRYWEPVILHLGVAETGLLQDTIAELTRTALQRIGPAGCAELPAALREELESRYIATRPAVDWRRALRLFAAGSRITSVHNTIRRPSRRYGMAPGIKVRRGSRLLVAVDTSASISREQLGEFWSEVHHLWKQGYHLRVVENDTDIRSQYDYQGRPPQYALGRGGTAFDAPLRLANEAVHPDGVVYFTDGQGPAPVVRCRYPLLWVIAGEGSDKGLPGRKVRMEAWKPQN